MINQLESGLSGEIFVDKNTAFVVEKYNPMDFVEKEIGDSKTPDKFIPQQKITRWDNEANVSIRLVHDENTPDVVVEGNDVVWKGKKVEARFYDVFNEEHKEGASEFEIILKEKPDTNVVKFTLNDKGVEYFYQPALTPEEITEGSERPENVVGSYAVYASENKTNWTDGKEYKVGKVGHIYRPKIIDSVGTEVWGDLHIENGILSVTIPQDFLDKAVYPVRHAAGLTFGYTSQGASDNDIYGGGSGGCEHMCSNYNLSVDGTLSAINGYLKTTAGTGSFKGLIYTDSGSAPQTRKAIGTGGTTTSTTYTNKTTAISASLTAGNYLLGFTGDGTTNHVYLAYDSGGAGYHTNGSGNFNYASPPDPWSCTGGATADTRKNSVYATYTATGVGNTGTHTDTGSGDTTAFDSGSTGSDRILVVGFSNYDTTSADRQVSTVTYGGSSLTKVTNSVADNATSNGRAEIWYLVAPATGSNNLVVTYAGANDVTNSDYFYTIFTGIDQTNPINTSDNHTTTGGTQDRITLTTTVDNCMLVDVNNGDAGGQTLGAGQTSLMDLGGSTGRGSFKQATAAGAYNMDMNTGSNDNYAHGAIALQPVGSGGGVVYIPRMGFIFHNHGIA